MNALLLGTALALIALAFVLQPLFTNAGDDATLAPDRREPSATDEAVEPMRADEAPALPPDEAEAMIERYRGVVAVCPACGERPEPAAQFCSSCGRHLG